MQVKFSFAVCNSVRTHRANCFRDSNTIKAVFIKRFWNLTLRYHTVRLAGWCAFVCVQAGFVKNCTQVCLLGTHVVCLAPDSRGAACCTPTGHGTSLHSGTHQGTVPFTLACSGHIRKWSAEVCFQAGMVRVWFALGAFRRPSGIMVRYGYSTLHQESDWMHPKCHLNWRFFLLDLLENGRFRYGRESPRSQRR